MHRIPSSSVVIIPSPLDRPLLQEVIQAMRHVQAILALNEDAAIAPGQLQGMSSMLDHAEQALAASSAALPAVRHARQTTRARRPAWLGFGHALTPMA